MPRKTAKRARRSPPERDARISSGVSSTSSPGQVKVTRVDALKSRQATRAGTPQSLLNMPLDIVLEILTYLGPRELLQLARTNKAFRAMLMSRTSQSVWKASRRNASVPERPARLSEPAFAHLLYSNYCHICLTLRSVQPMWEYGVRYCGDCKKARFPCMESTIHEEFDGKAFSFFNFLTVRRGPRKHRVYYYHIPEMEYFRSAWHMLGGDKDLRRKFIQENTQLREKKIQFGRFCKLWVGDQAVARAEELDRIREKRLNAIVEKLRAMGYKEEIEWIARDDYAPLSEHRLVRKAEPLTARAWKGMKEEIIDLMDEVRDEWLDRRSPGIEESRIKTRRG
ncbi:hypothetical protein OBBRIDRAFT_792126 [Obba rivulosa]|uniref:F-box domain-containing protein n=1 Tax=Obba rivulosa TaxID=1052685 RepID=A0A8E2B0D8_9APHY|nr:hypothetical protein OBBRIDRAFT_792126 [Obba rivulosa]